MSDGDDDQPPRGQKRRERSRSRERVYPHAPVPHVPQTQPMVTPEHDDVSDEDSTSMNPSSPSAGPPPSAEQRGRSRREHQPHAPSHASQQPQPAALPSGTQQIHPLATQGTDEDSATVEPQSHVGDRSRSPPRKESPQKQGPQKSKGKENPCRKSSRMNCLRPKKHKPMDSDEDDEEPQNEPGIFLKLSTQCTSTISSSRTSSKFSRTSCQ